jgi:hypothetical protein
MRPFRTPLGAARAAAASVLACMALATPAAHAETVSGSGRAVTQAREARGFSAVELAIPGKMEIVQGDREGLAITADDNLLPEIETVVERESLRIRFRRGLNVRTRTPIRITLHARTIEAIAIAGSGDVLAPSINSRDLAVRVSGSGDVHLGGKADSLRVRISGSGEVKADRLEAQRAQVSIAGSGDVTVWARQALEVSLAGSGDVRYYGDPTITRKIAGSGSVRRAGASPG